MDISPNNKKRKLSHSDDQDDEDNEEVKIEKFFAIIRNIQDAPERMMNGSEVLRQQELIDDKRKKRKLEKENLHVPVWNPSFQLEDFLEAKNPIVVSTIANTSQRNEVPEKEEAKEELDLRLSL